jgi:hypothetical protein
MGFEGNMMGETDNDIAIQCSTECKTRQKSMKTRETLESYL